MPAAGRMRHAITVTYEALVDRPDGGQDVTEVVVVDHHPCEFVPLTDEERLANGTLYATARHRARMYLVPAVLARAPAATTPDAPLGPEMTAAIFDPWTQTTRQFQIAAVTNVQGEGRELDLMLTERVT